MGSYKVFWVGVVSLVKVGYFFYRADICIMCNNPPPPQVKQTAFMVPRQKMLSKTHRAHSWSIFFVPLFDASAISCFLTVIQNSNTSSSIHTRSEGLEHPKTASNFTVVDEFQPLVYNQGCSRKGNDGVTLKSSCGFNSFIPLWCLLLKT